MPAQLMPGGAATARAVVVVTHGLNTKPDIMDELGGELVRDGLAWVRVSLYFDGLRSRMPPHEVAEGWTAQVREGLLLAAREHPGVPIYALGFSTGAMATLTVDAETLSRVERMVLLAPPIALKPLARLVRPLTPLWRIGLGLPSAAPRAVRERWWTPFSEYGALLGMHDRIRAIATDSPVRSIPTHVLVDARDELVSLEGVGSWVTEAGLERWRVGPIVDRNPRGRVYRHLVVTSDALGDAGWRSLTGTVRRSFSDDQIDA